MQESDSEEDHPPSPPPKTALPQAPAGAASIYSLLAKQAAEHKPRPLDLSDIDPSFWAPVDAVAAAAAGTASDSDAKKARTPDWLLQVAKSCHAQALLEEGHRSTEAARSMRTPVDPPLDTAITRADLPPVEAGTASASAPGGEDQPVGGAYVSHLRAVVSYALNSPACAGLLTASERSLAERFQDLDLPSASLLSRLFQRKGPWFRLSALRYAELTGRPGWWEREAAGTDAEAAARPGLPDADGTPAAADPLVHAAALAVAVRTLVDAGFLLPLPGFASGKATSGPTDAEKAGPGTPCAAAPAVGGSVNAFARLMVRGPSRGPVAAGAAPGVGSVAAPAAAPLAPPADVLLCLEAVHCCFTVPELRSLLAQLGGVGAGRPATDSKPAPPKGAAAVTPGGPSARSMPAFAPTARGPGSAGPAPPTRSEMLQQLTERVFKQRTVLGGPLPLAKCVLACLPEHGAGLGADAAGSSAHQRYGRASPGAPAVTPAKKLPRQHFGLVSSSAGAKRTGALSAAKASAAVGGGGQLSASPLVRVSRDAYAMLRRAHCLYYIATATSNLSSGQGTGAWTIAGGAATLHAGLPDVAGDGLGALIVPINGAVTASKSSLLALSAERIACIAAAVARWRGRSPLEVSSALNSATGDTAAAAAAASGRPRGSKWNTSSSGSRYADSAGASDSFIPAGAGVGAGAVSLARDDGGGAAEHWRLYRLSSGESWPNGGLYSPALLQTFRKLDFAPYSCNAVTRVVPSIAHFRLLEAAHLFRAQVRDGGVGTDKFDSYFSAIFVSIAFRLTVLASLGCSPLMLKLLHSMPSLKRSDFLALSLVLALVRVTLEPPIPQLPVHLIHQQLFRNRPPRLSLPVFSSCRMPLYSWVFRVMCGKRRLA